MKSSLLGLTCLVLVACNDETSSVEPDAAWSTLVSGPWSLSAGGEGHFCVYSTLAEAIAIGELQPIAPPGTHHVTLGLAPSYVGDDGVVPCTGGDVGDALIFASGVGTSPLKLPAGTGIALPAGARLLANLHLYNASSESLDGLSGVEYRAVAPESLERRLEAVLAGPTTFTIPPGRVTEHTGGCTVLDNGGIVALMPHMHQLGVHLEAHVARVDGTELALADGPYDFEAQQYAVFEPAVEVAAGDRIEVTCTWENTTTDAVGFGQSTRSEMCFVGTLRYPASASPAICDH
jgi:hypothetical protein